MSYILKLDKTPLKTYVTGETNNHVTWRGMQVDASQYKLETSFNDSCSMTLVS